MNRGLIAKVLLAVMALSFVAGCACMQGGGAEDHRAERASNANKGGK